MIIKTIIVVNDLANNNLSPKHGLSILIDIGSSRILFDCGPDSTIIRNLNSLNLDVKSINIVILSHGHYDHTGGLEFILKNNKTARIHAHPQVFIDRFKIEGKKVTNIAIPQSCKKSLLKLPNHRLALEKFPVKFASFIGLSGEIKSNTLPNTYHQGNKYFLDKECKTLDTHVDEQALWIKHENGLIIFTGCCHAGLPNIIEQVKKVAKEDKIYGVIGGFHLKKEVLNSNIFNTMIEYLSHQYPLQKIVACHCTDESIISVLKEKFSNRIITGKAGMEIIW